MKKESVTLKCRVDLNAACKGNCSHLCAIVREEQEKEREKFGPVEMEGPGVDAWWEKGDQITQGG